MTGAIEAPRLATAAPARQDADDGRLMARVAAGDAEAFAPIVERYQDALVRYLQRAAGSRESAEDLAQEAFLRLYRAAGRYRHQARLRGYLFHIATNLLRSEERRRRRWRLLTPLLPTEEASLPLALERVLGGEAEERVRRALAELPVRYRAPLVLFEVEGWSLSEIAEVLECREGTVKSRLHRGRQRLRRRLEASWGAEDE